MNKLTSRFAIFVSLPDRAIIAIKLGVFRSLNPLFVSNLVDIPLDPYRNQSLFRVLA